MKTPKDRMLAAKSRLAEKQEWFDQGKAGDGQYLAFAIRLAQIETIKFTVDSEGRRVWRRYLRSACKSVGQKPAVDRSTGVYYLPYGLTIKLNQGQSVISVETVSDVVKGKK